MPDKNPKEKEMQEAYERWLSSPSTKEWLSRPSTKEEREAEAKQLLDSMERNRRLYETPDSKEHLEYVKKYTDEVINYGKPPLLRFINFLGSKIKEAILVPYWLGFKENGRWSFLRMLFQILFLFLVDLPIRFIFSLLAFTFLGPIGWLGIILVLLRFVGVIHWPWWLVALPLEFGVIYCVCMIIHGVFHRARTEALYRRIKERP